MDAEPWYAARSLFLTRATADHPSHYEERIVLLRADDEAHALRRAEEEAEAYAAGLKNTEYLGFLDVFHLFEDSIGDLTEVFSLMRDSDLPPADYLSRFFATGSERSRNAEPEGPI